MTDYKTWRFHALDTWFFREARPFDTIGSPELASHFPPPAPTVAGAIKTLVGRQAGIDWRDFKPKGEGDPGDDRYGLLGKLRLRGPFLCRDGEPLFSAPLFLLKDKESKYQRLVIGDAVETDLGKVRLPCFKPGDRDCKPLENAWLTLVGLRVVLDGGEPTPKDVFLADQIFTHESRLGIGRDNDTGTVRAEEALLYQTRHVRPRDGVGLMVGVAGLPPEVRPEPVRLGGEGRLALVDVAAEALELPKAPTPDGDTHGLILILLTPADLDDCWRLPKSEPVYPAGGRDSTEAKYWHTEIKGVGLRIYSAVLGKPRREGGWHLAEGKPRRVDSFVPPGSAWYCEVENMGLQDAIDKLHGIQVGDGEKLGRGLLAVGLWQRCENFAGQA